MVDIAPTDVVITPATRFNVVQLGEAAALLDVVYKAPDGKYLLTDAKDVAKAAKPEYLIYKAGAADDYVPAIPLRGTINFVGETLVVNTEYVLSATPGKLAPKADLLTGQYLTEIMNPSTATGGPVVIQATGVAMP